jgi:hypothetical protein
LVSVRRAVLGLDTIEKFVCARKRVIRKLQTGQFATLQSHELPAQNGGVAGLTGKIPPAAERMLHADDEVERSLRGLTKLWIVGKRIRFAERERRKTLCVHRPFLQIRAAGIRLNAADEILEAICDDGLVLASAMRLPRAEKREQRERGRSSC